MRWRRSSIFQMFFSVSINFFILQIRFLLRYHNSADSQFFICFDDARFLDRQYTVWGKVASGMEFVDKIKKGDARQNGIVVNPDKIVKMQVAADVKE